MRMIDAPLFDRVVNHLAGARSRVVVISAFVRGAALERLLAEARPKASKEVFARWRLPDLAAGASDVAAINVAKKYGAKFRVHHHLHAKVYIADNKALVGSANVTDSGLGIAKNPNLEILSDCNAKQPDIVSLLNRLQKEAKPPPNFDMRQIHKIAAKSPAPGFASDDWLPSSPIDEFCAIFKRGAANFSDAALADCLALNLSPGMPLARVKPIVAERRVFAVLRAALSKEYIKLSRKEAIRALAAEFSLSPKKVEAKWQTIAEWINRVCPDFYVAGDKDDAEIRQGRMLLQIRK